MGIIRRNGCVLYVGMGVYIIRRNGCVLYVGMGGYYT